MILRKYGEETEIVFPLVDYGATRLQASLSFASGDIKVSKDGGAFTNTTNTPTGISGGVYKLTLTAAEMGAARIVVTVVDQTSPPTWEDQVIAVDTYGHASAQHAFDLDGTASGSASAIADAVCDEALSGHTSSGTVGEALGRITATSVSVSSPVATDGDVTIYKGDDYSTDQTLDFTITSWSGFDCDGASGTFRMLKVSDYDADDTAADLSKDVTYAQSGTTITVSVTLDAADTASLETAPPDTGANYKYQLRANPSSKLCVVGEGDATVKKVLVASS